MTLADRIRDHVQVHFVESARHAAVGVFTVKAGDVHRQLKLTNRMPAVCEALRSKILQSRCGIKLVEWYGPEQGSTATAQFNFVSMDQKNGPASDVDLNATQEIDLTPIGPLETVEWRRFQDLARIQMEHHFGCRFSERNLQGVPKRFDMVSTDGAIVGDAKYLSLVGGKRTPPAKFMEIAGHVWLLEKTNAKSIFLVFGNQRDVVSRWLKKYGSVAGRVEMYFLSADGTLERMH